MKNSRILFLTLLIFTASTARVYTQATEPKRIAILPIQSNGIDSIYVQTAESILRTEISKLTSMDIISMKRTREVMQGTVCTESECALEAGKNLGAVKVLSCQLSALGEKIIVQYFLVDVPQNKQVLIDQTTAANAEDLEVLMKRLAKSVVDLEPVGANAEVGTILTTEAQEPARRASRNNFGVSFGYLFPDNGYGNGKKSLILDGRFDHEVNDFAIGLLAGIREGFSMSIYGDYLFSRTDFCPYIGTGLGFHWVSHESDPTNYSDPYATTSTSKRGDGVEFGLNTGVRIMHTYDFQIIFNFEYIVTFNDYDDRAFIFTIGIL